MGDQDFQPVRDDGIPFCDDDCQQHDGKRCRILGCSPAYHCEPAIEALIATLAAEQQARAAAEAEVAALRGQIRCPNCVPDGSDEGVPCALHAAHQATTPEPVEG